MEHQAFKRVNACQIQMRQGGNLPRQLQNMPAGYAGAPGTCIHFQTHFAGKTSFSGRPAQRGGSLQAVNRQDQPFHPFLQLQSAVDTKFPHHGISDEDIFHTACRHHLRFADFGTGDSLRSCCQLKPGKIGDLVGFYMRSQFAAAGRYRLLHPANIFLFRFRIHHNAGSFLHSCLMLPDQLKHCFPHLYDPLSLFKTRSQLLSVSSAVKSTLRLL